MRVNASRSRDRARAGAAAASTAASTRSGARLPSIVTRHKLEGAVAEAALAWLNWHAQVRLEARMAPSVVVGVLADRLESELLRAGLAIAHVKVLDQAESGYVRVSLFGDGRAPAVDGVLDASPAMRHQLLVNARVVGQPEVLSRVVGECLRALGGEVPLMLRETFRPPPPRPERRVIT
jgi:hypothetical protein